MSRPWPAPGNEYSGLSKPHVVAGFLNWGITNCVYTTLIFFVLKTLRDTDVVSFSFTWRQVGLVVTAAQFARVWDRALMR